MQWINVAWQWIQAHWIFLAMLPAQILVIESVVRQDAVNHGYKNVVSWCDHIANAVGFIRDLIAGIISTKTTTGGK